MTDQAFRLILDALMCNDPEPAHAQSAYLLSLVESESFRRGFKEWETAFLEFRPENAIQTDES